MAKAIPNLYLKWLAFRELLQPAFSNAEIAARLWGPDDGPSRFSKLLRGDYGCESDVADELAEIVNRRIAAVRGAKGQGPAPTPPLRGVDLEAPTFEFARRIVEATEVIDSGQLERAHRALIAPFMPEAPEAGVSLAIERFALSRFFEGVEAPPSGPTVFEVGRHKGLFAVEGLPEEDLRRPPLAYALFARDVGPIGGAVWDAPFGETVRWIASPFRPVAADRRLLLFPEPKPVQASEGRFRVTAVFVRDEGILGRLDPRGAGASPRALDEEETARFLTNLPRVAKTHGGALVVCAGEYMVRRP